jgi:hypothetical protein
MPNHFIAKFTKGGGPPPDEELARILDQAESSPDHEAWFGTRKPGKKWDDVGICILLAAPTLDGILAEVRERRDRMPDDPATRELYPGCKKQFAAWWRIRNPIRVHFESLEEIPGNHISGPRAPDVFRGRVAFAYWNFGSECFDDLAARIAIVNSSMPRLTRPDCAIPTVNSPLIADSNCELWPRPEFPLYGVDFAGGSEDQRHGNKKIWVAEWSSDKNVRLLCGWSANSGEKICRADLPELIKQWSGWWSLDFPFGVAKETARALGLKGWQEWLQWCGSAVDATQLRNEARQATNRASVAWAARRQVDEDHKTTWFPLFEQLYRQTIYGAREVLLPLQKTKFCILPWASTAIRQPAAVVEGFPGATIRRRLMKNRVSYKGSTAAHKGTRQAIVSALSSAPFAIPIPRHEAVKAVEDEDGDALDALVLLVGSWVAQRLPTEEWRQQLGKLDRLDAAIEGWFPI